MRRWPALLAAVLLGVPAALAGCQREEEEVPAVSWDWERMTEQRRYDAYEATDLFADGTVMRPPPEGTVPRERVLGPPEVVYGLAEAPAVETVAAGAATPRHPRPVDRVPIPLTRELLEAGRHRFEIFCAACHGRSGDGTSPVAEAMELRAPPSLLSPRVRELPDGAVYRVIREGYGLMPSYAADLGVEERWAVVAYLRALQWSQGVPADELPDAMRRELDRLDSGEGAAGEGPAR